MTIEEYLNKPYWVIDILPKQVPADSKGQYFRIEKYYWCDKIALSFTYHQIELIQ